MKSLTIKSVAVTLIIVAVFIVINQFHGLLDNTIFAHIDSLENARKYKTVTWKTILLDKMMIIQGMALEPFYVKVVWSNGRIGLLDRRERKVFLINSEKKTVKIMTIGLEVPDLFADIYDSIRNFKNMPGYSIEKIGQRQIGGKRAIGFHLTNKKENDAVTVWIDSHSQLPMHIEFFEANELGQVEQKMIWCDIVFDVELNESLFRFDLDGYKVEKLDSFQIE